MRAFFPKKTITLTVVAVLLSALLLVSLDGRRISVLGWFGYSLILGVGVTLILLTWRWIKTDETPRGVLTAAFVAMIIRIVVGLILVRALPVYGYDQDVNKAGYVYYDAYKRDRDALALARSDLPLSTAFTAPYGSDQYGGLLFLSAGTYRFISPDAHRPLFVTSLAAIAAALGIIFCWRFSRWLFANKSAILTAWLMALFPESILLGASQMREPFLITAFSSAFLGYAVWREGNLRQALSLLVIGVILLAFPLSPPFALIILSSLMIAWLWEGKSFRISSWFLFGGGLVVILATIFFAARSWGQLEGATGSFWEILVSWWNNAGAQWRINILTEQSLNLDLILDRIPGWSHIPFLVFFGIAQPFLPAALMDPGAAIWRTIGILRSLGWYLMIPFLLYAPFVSIRKKGWRSFVTFSSLFVWITALAASYRASSYQWDNPRYRVAYLIFQTALMGWLWVHTRETKDRWVPRLGGVILGPLLVISHWYLGRHYGTPSLGLTTTIILAIGLAGLLLTYFFIRDMRSSQQSRMRSKEV